MEPASALAPVEPRSSSYALSPLEIAGLAAAVFPFFFGFTTFSSETVNGETSVVYRDWIALVGGAVAIPCGIVRAVKLRSGANRGFRIGLAAAMIALALLQLARGVGFGADIPESSSAPGVRTSPAVIPDVDGPTRRIFDAWRDGRIAEIYAAAHPELRKATPLAEMQDLHDLFVAGFGTPESIGKLTSDHRNDVVVVTGTIVYPKGTLDLELQYQLVDGKPLLSFLKIDIPKPLQVEPVPADGDRVARQLLDSLLAGKLDEQLLEPGTKPRDQTREELDAGIERLVAKLGKLKTIGSPQARDCEATRCIAMTIVGSKARATFTAELSFRIRTWRIAKFDFGLDEK